MLISTTLLVIQQVERFALGCCGYNWRKLFFGLRFGGFPVGFGGFPVERFPVERHSLVLKKKRITKYTITCSNMSIQYCIVLIHGEILFYGNYIIPDEIKVSEGVTDRGDIE